MTTVLLADRDGSSFGSIGSRTIPALLPVQAVPLLEHSLRALVAAGIRSALVVTGPRAEEVERRFGKGIRLGIALEYVRRGDTMSVADVLRQLENRLDGETWVFRGDVGNHAGISEFMRKAEPAGADVVSGSFQGRPVGLWKLGPGAAKKAEFPREPSAPEWVGAADQSDVEIETPCVLIDSIAAYRRADAADRPAVSARAMVYPAAVLEAGTTVAEESVVCPGARLRNVSVLQKSAIPAGVTLEDAVVSGNQVVSVETGKSFLVSDLLPSQPGPEARSLSQKDQFLGLCLFLLSLPLWPVALVWSLIANAGHATRKVTWNLNGPGKGSEGLPKRAPVASFRFETAVPVLKDLPLVLQVARGRLALSGVAPMTPSDEESISEGWARVRREGLVGLLAPSRLLSPAAAPAEVSALLDAFEARRVTPGLLRLGFKALLGAGGWAAAKAFNPDELEEPVPSER